MALWEMNRQMIRVKHPFKMLDTVLNARSFWNLLVYYPNGRVTGFDSAFGASSGL